MSASTTDDLIDAVLTAVDSSGSAYFSTMAETGFALQTVKTTRKGQPTLKWLSPSVYAVATKATKVDRYLERVEVNVLYLLRGDKTEYLAKSIARGADALASLIQDKFSVTRIECDFDYGVADGTSEAAALITAEIAI